jgi:hypothetical protein
MVFDCDGRKITLYATGSNHAGENLQEKLKNRSKDLGPILLMCDALSRNVSPDLATELCYCLLHARRNYFNLVGRDKIKNPETYLEKKVRQILLVFGRIYYFESLIKEAALSDEERMFYHQRRSGRLINVLLSWGKRSIDQKLIEPNSTPGKAIAYLENHKKELTKFLSIPGALIDNNITERALKPMVLNKKNALFYKTDLGAFVGDICTSVIRTCINNDINPLHYMTCVHKNKDAVKKCPEKWLPWNYQQEMQRIAAEKAIKETMENNNLPTIHPESS